MEPRWNTQEAADFLGLRAHTLHNWRWRGYGPPYLKFGGAVRYDPAAVRAWQAQQVRLSTSDTGAKQ